MTFIMTRWATNGSSQTVGLVINRSINQMVFCKHFHFMIFKNQWNLAHSWSHSCQVQMAFVLFWTANIGHNCSIDYRQVLHFYLNLHFVWFLIIRCEKSHIWGHILFTVYSKLIVLGKQSLCCTSASTLPLHFSNKFAETFAVDNNKKKYSLHQSSSWVKENRVMAMLSTLFIHPPFNDKAFWMLPS